MLQYDDRLTDNMLSVFLGLILTLLRFDTVFSSHFIDQTQTLYQDSFLLKRSRDFSIQM